ncbi:MAG: GNAT family N-acetyltransferase [Desulfobacteraceae bacterium]|nr:MAG: GNAT family N-acetyltransferase [Desulfobacteraceae bacterium]
MKHFIYDDPEQCRRIWYATYPVNHIWDLWEVRSCFHEVYQKPLQFHTIQNINRIVGLLPLSWNEETGQYVFFPGETWKGKTWLEQNRIIAENGDVFYQLLQHVPNSLYLRYLTWHPFLSDLEETQADEVGYLFYPGLYDFIFENYWLGFSGKTRKKIKSELKRLEDQKITFRFDEVKDLDQMFLMNRISFLEDSYFDDPRFYNSFDRLASMLSDMGMLRIVTVLIGGRIAAVDMGGVFKNTCTMFAGGTSQEFCGVAKLINLHHMEWACRKRLDEVDFLCGDFNWKERFHLSPRPLFQIRLDKIIGAYVEVNHEKQTICA